MDVTDVIVDREDKRGKVYDCDKVKLIRRKKGSESADHEHKHSEVLFLLRGEIRLSIGDLSRPVSAPKRINIPAWSYHKYVALSDIELIEYKY